MSSLPCRLRAGVRRFVLRTVLAGLTAATVPVALAYPPPGATVAPSTAATNQSFPKRITARGPGFGSWSSAMVMPLFGRTGYSGTAIVEGTSAGIGNLTEFDNNGNATFRVSPQQPSVFLESTGDASRFFARQVPTGGTEVAFGIYSSSGANAAVFQHRMAANADRTSIVRGLSPARIYVTRDLNTEVEVLVFREDGTLESGRRYASSFFGVNTGLPTDSQSATAVPLAGGGAILEVMKNTISFTTGAMTSQTALIRLSATGDVVWAKRISGDASFTVNTDSASGSIYLGGTEISMMGGATSSIAKLTSAGALVWSRRLSGAFLSPVGELTNGRLLVSGAVMDMQFAPTDSAFALLSSSGAVESQFGISFAARNSAVAVIEGNRMWISVTSGNVSGGGADGGPVHVGLADGDFSNLRWRRYANAMSDGITVPDFDSDAVVASFFNMGSGALEVMTFNDDFSSSVNSTLLPSVTATSKNPGITAADAGYTLTDITVTATGVTPTLQTAALTFTTLPVTESTITTGGSSVPATIGTQPASQKVNPGAAVSFTVAVNNPSSQTLSYQWSFNGAPISGATAATYSIASAQAAQVGAYTVAVTAGTTTLQSSTALLELNATTRPVGESVLFASDIQHPNGNIYDQFLLTGSATVITADPGQVARISFIDANDDIVQVEYSGAGSLTLQLANATGPAVAVNYNQATVSYMKGTPTITIAGADQTSNLGIFSVGSVTGNPAVLKSGVTYDGFANVALITISSANGQFGGVRIGNALLSGSSGNVGLVATGVNFTGPIVIGDIDASGTASPKLLTGTVAGLTGFPGEIRIAGGDLLQTNGRAIEFGTATAVRMGAGTNAHGVSLPAKTVAGRLERNGQDVTSTVVISSTSTGSSFRAYQATSTAGPWTASTLSVPGADAGLVDPAPILMPDNSILMYYLMSYVTNGDPAASQPNNQWKFGVAKSTDHGATFTHQKVVYTYTSSATDPFPLMLPSGNIRLLSSHGTTVKSVTALDATGLEFPATLDAGNRAGSGGVPGALRVGSTYFLYVCSGGSIGYLTSTDGLTFSGGGTAIAATSGEMLCDPSPIDDGGGRYVMAYKRVPPGGRSPSDDEVYIATSTNGITWTSALRVGTGSVPGLVKTATGVYRIFASGGPPVT